MNKDDLYYTSAIGADEVGTGEVFRPQVYVACFVSKNQILMLEQLGVKDSKKLTRKKCCEIAPEIMKLVPHASYSLTNEKLNRIYEKYNNLNQIKAMAHAAVIDSVYKQVADKTEKIILDKFCSEEKFLEYLNGREDFYSDLSIYIEKGEDAHLAVACASIIATYLEEQEIEKIETEIGTALPGGNSPKAKPFMEFLYQKYGEEGIKKYAKLNFKNVQEFLDNNK